MGIINVISTLNSVEWRTVGTLCGFRKIFGYRDLLDSVTVITVKYSYSCRSSATHGNVTFLLYIPLFLETL